jgi:hypothetical protein
MGAEVENIAKSPIYIVEALHQPISHLPMQEIDAAAACRAITMQPPSAIIEQRDRLDRHHLGGAQPVNEPVLTVSVMVSLRCTRSALCGTG